MTDGNVVIRDSWDINEWGQFVPAASIRFMPPYVFTPQLPSGPDQYSVIVTEQDSNIATEIDDVLITQ